MARPLVEEHDSEYIWVRNTIECPLQEYLRRTLQYRLSPVAHYGEYHDRLLKRLYPNARLEVVVRKGGIAGRVDAIDGGRVIEHKVVAAPVTPLLATPRVLRAIARGVQDIVASLMPVLPGIGRPGANNVRISEATKPSCVGANPFTIGCIARAYFGVELDAKKFYERTRRYITDHIYKLPPEDYEALAELIRNTPTKPSSDRVARTAAPIAVGAVQAVTYAKLLGGDYKPVLSLSIVPRTRLLPIVNIEFDLGGLRDNVYDFERAVEVVRNPQGFKPREVARLKLKPCRYCDLRAVCPFRSELEGFDREIIERDRQLAGEVVRVVEERAQARGG